MTSVQRVAQSTSSTGRVQQIRGLFLEDREYSVAELANLWQITVADVLADVLSDEIAIWREAHPERDVTDFRVTASLAREASVSYNLVRACEIEDALGDAFGSARAVGWRTRALTLRPPEWLIQIANESPLFLKSHSLEARVEYFLLAFFAHDRPGAVPPTRTETTIKRARGN
jgi:hypothetical protein